MKYFVCGVAVPCVSIVSAISAALLTYSYYSNQYILLYDIGHDV